MRGRMRQRFKLLGVIVMLFPSLVYAGLRIEQNDTSIKQCVTLLLPIELSSMPSLWFHPYAYTPVKNVGEINSSAFAKSGIIRSKSLIDLQRGRLRNSTIEQMLKDPLGQVSNGIGHRLEMRFYNFQQSKSRKPGQQGNMFYSLGDESLTELRVHRDFMGMVFRGNAPYSGKSIQSNPFIFRHMSFQKIGIGWTEVVDGPSAFNKWYVQLSGLAGRNWADLQLSQSSIYNSASGDSIVLNAEGTYRGLLGKENPYFSGGGLAIDAGWMRRNGNFYFSGQLNNVGFMQWFRETDDYRWDHQLVYQGLEWNRVERNFQQPAGLSDTGFSSLGESASRKNIRSLLPYQLYLKSGWKYHKQVFSVLAEHRNGGVFRAALGLEHEWFFHEKMRWSNHLTAGGYNRYEWHSSLDAMLANKIVLQLGIGGFQMLWGHRGGPSVRLNISSTL